MRWSTSGRLGAELRLDHFTVKLDMVHRLGWEFIGEIGQFDAV